MTVGDGEEAICRRMGKLGCWVTCVCACVRVCDFGVRTYIFSFAMSFVVLPLALICVAILHYNNAAQPASRV